MTANQHKAIELAWQIVRDATTAGELCDSDWALLLLAAGVNNISTRPAQVANRVLNNWATHSGYFVENPVSEVPTAHEPQLVRPAEPEPKSADEPLLGSIFAA